MSAGATADTIGPFNAVFLQGGVGISQPLPPDSLLSRAGAPWTLAGWLRIDVPPQNSATVAALGEPLAPESSCLVLEQDVLALRFNRTGTLRSRVRLGAGGWHAVAAVYDGATAHLYVDGTDAGAVSVRSADVAPVLRLAPERAEDRLGEEHFGGALAQFALVSRALAPEEVRTLAKSQPDFALIAFNQVGVGWPWQAHAWRGLLEPQPAWTLPHGNAPLTPTAAHPQPFVAGMRELDPATWRIDGWRLAGANEVSASGADLSRGGFDDTHWYAATVPGTVLTTLIDNGVYPDPDYGLNNLAIPESLSHQDYWYRSEFVLPGAAADRRLTLTFNGVNYAAEVWLNGARVGALRGAFIRGTFEVSAQLHAHAPNVLAVRVSPPPHPGIAHEQSVAAGPGENGGNLALDGPTFIASEGWDWIPGIRDRNTGLWQDVQLHATGALRLLDPKVTSILPLPRTDSADVTLRVPVENTGSASVSAVIEAAFGEVRVRKQLLLPPGLSEVLLQPAEFPQLHLAHPHLWWPNGYGEPALYALRLAVSTAGVVADRRSLHFGIRQFTYELSLFDHRGRLRRVLVDPSGGSAQQQRLIDVRHQAIKRTANGWAESLTAAGEDSSAVQDIAGASLSPFLVIRVNGVRIAARGGSWGMDDSRKRSSRERLEPFFRLHRQAHLNIIRNWLGQNTEEVFYDLADEYGLLVLNDFWESTQDFQVEAEDPQLFLANAADVIRRFGNHPSIVAWFGRNEGVPQPIINEGLADLVARLDGTRYYTGSSNRVNLQDSGPYNYRPPVEYFTRLAQGFAVELGTPSLASLETLESYIPPTDRWPLGDAYAYHDWHFGGNGDTATFMRALERSLGAADNLPDFERKAQLLDYVSYRAIFEGFAAGMWTRNSARLLWMTHPAWPSNAWQIYTSDYDAAAAYYAVAKACEPVHAQLNLPDFRLAVINTTREARAALTLISEVVDLQGRLLLKRTDHLAAAANDVTTLAPLEFATLLAREKLVFVRLTLRASDNTVLSRNLYWQSSTDEDLQRLAGLAPQTLAVTAQARPDGADTVVRIALANRSQTPVLQARLVALDARGGRVLPVYYSDNYVTLLPGDSQEVLLHCPAAASPCAQIAVRGWNAAPLHIPIQASVQEPAAVH
jgi:hypothetical protein